MTIDPLHVIFGHLTGDAALDTATSRAILQRVATGDLPETLQVGMPHSVLAFGKHDALTAGFPAAVATAVEHGYDPTVRIAGGRAVVFHPATVRFAWTVPEPEPAPTMHDRFKLAANAVIATLATFGIDSEMGELPNEYCAGAYSVHLRNGGKVMGVGQRLSRTAAQVGGMIAVDDAASINSVLIPIYRSLDIPLDPGATASVAEAAPADPASIADELARQLAAGRMIVEVAPDRATVRLATGLRPDHVPAPLA